MRKPDIKANEAQGLKTLHEYNALDPLPQKNFDVIASNASQECGMPASLITIVDKKQDELEKTIDLFEQTSQVAKIGGWEVDLKHNQINWTNVIKEIHEVTGDFALSIERGLDFYKPGESRDTITHIVNQALATETSYNVELQIITAKGNERWIRTKGQSVFEDGKCVRLYGIMQDIHAEKLKDIKLAQSEQQFRQMFADAAIGMEIIALDGKWLKANNSLCNLIGYSEKELQQMSFQQITPPEDLVEEMALFDKTLAGELPSYEIEKRYIHKDGHIIWIIRTVSVIRDQNNQPVHLISQVVDVSVRKEIEHKTKLLTDVTNEQNSRLVNFAHIVSHNLRTHSGNISTLLDFFEEDETEAEKQKTFSLIKTAAAELAETIDNLAEVVSVDTNIDENIESINLYKAIEKVQSNIKGLLIEQNVECINQVDARINISGVPAYVDSILLNLFTNSIKYKSIQRLPVITLGSQREGDFAVLSFSDNGKGIDMKKFGDKLFGMYKTFHGNKDARGVGLFITKNQIEAMGGKISVESVVGEGTTFKIFFKWHKELLCSSFQINL